MSKWQDRLRVIWAIAAKDIGEGIRNKTILSIIASTVFLVLFYRFLPALESADSLPRLTVYDMGQSRLVAALENSTQFEFRELHSLDKVEAFVGNADDVRLGLVLPSDFDQALAAGQPPVLEGYVTRTGNCKGRFLKLSKRERKQVHVLHSLSDSLLRI